MKKEELSEGDEDSGGDDTPKMKRKQVECIMGDYTTEELRNMHPQRQTFTYRMGKNLVTFTSDFDAGNMVRCEQMESGNHVRFIFSPYILYLVQYLDVQRFHALLQVHWIQVSSNKSLHLI
jgi:hypothetical protein